MPTFTEAEKGQEQEWIKKKQEADEQKEEDRLKRMQAKIKEYRKAQGIET
jgi:hypothetical protein